MSYLHEIYTLLLNKNHNKALKIIDYHRNMTTISENDDYNLAYIKIYIIADQITEATHLIRQFEDKMLLGYKMMAKRIINENSKESIGDFYKLPNDLNNAIFLTKSKASKKLYF
jgi:uncharacterized membrane protein YcjF (UPF0283 family)